MARRVRLCESETGCYTAHAQRSGASRRCAVGRGQNPKPGRDLLSGREALEQVEEPEALEEVEAAEAVEEVRAESMKRRYRVGKLFETYYGMRQFVLYDPDGYKLVLQEPTLGERSPSAKRGTA